MNLLKMFIKMSVQENVDKIAGHFFQRCQFEKMRGKGKKTIEADVLLV